MTENQLLLQNNIQFMLNSCNS